MAPPRCLGAWTLERLIDTWFPIIKDKIPIIFQYINMDIKTTTASIPDIHRQNHTTRKEIADGTSSSQFLSSLGKLFSLSTPLGARLPAQLLLLKKITSLLILVHFANIDKESTESGSESSFVSLAEFIHPLQATATTSRNQHATDHVASPIDKPVSPSNNHSDSPLSSLPSTPSLPQPPFASFSCSPPLIFLLSTPP